MRKVLIITNYNYESFLEDCLLSIKRQTFQFDKIIFIDDGSTDNSVKIVRKIFDGHKEIIIKEKSNGGQLSCFNTAVSEILPDDLVFLIDSDDVYANDYVEIVSPYFEKSDADLIFTTPVEFKSDKEKLESAMLCQEKFLLFSSTSAITRMTQCWIGSPTSCISLRGSLYLSLFPYPYVKEWRTRADDIIIFGTSILGAKKLFLESACVGYRIHGNNNFARRTISRNQIVDRNFYLERLFTFFCKKAHINRRVSLGSALAEMKNIPKPYREKFFIPGCFGILKNFIIS